jgi:hypothetical protein
MRARWPRSLIKLDGDRCRQFEIGWRTNTVVSQYIQATLLLNLIGITQHQRITSSAPKNHLIRFYNSLR